MPFGSKEKAFQNASTLDSWVLQLSSAQAIADYAEIILHLKKYLLAESCPVIVVGGTIDGAPKGIGVIDRTCAEMVMPIGHGINSTMFEYSPFNLSEFSEGCRKLYGVDPRPHWVTTEFGGTNIKQVLAEFGSNIIFYNGLRDRYSSGGRIKANLFELLFLCHHTYRVLHNISDSIVAITTADGTGDRVGLEASPVHNFVHFAIRISLRLTQNLNSGSHCNDFGRPSPFDPEWLTRRRASEWEIIQGWIADYNDTRRAMPDSYITFQQKYIVDFIYWGGANTNAPIFVELGAESALGNSADDIVLAGRFNGLMVAIEHCYYGESIPFGSMDKAFRNASTLGYFSSAQAIADYAEVILHIMKNLSAENCPVIVFGGSYGGSKSLFMHFFLLLVVFAGIVVSSKILPMATGALASSAPILYFDDIVSDGYYAVVTKDFRIYEGLVSPIQQAQSGGYIDIFLTNFEKVFARSHKALQRILCDFHRLNTSFELKNLLDTTYCAAAQYNGARWSRLNETCDAIDGAPKGTGILGRVLAGVAAIWGDDPCYDTTIVGPVYEDGWWWQ
ncbi:hypothetical protein IFM89_001346, partial [Coptis chinensis]